MKCILTIFSFFPFYPRCSSFSRTLLLQPDIILFLRCKSIEWNTVLFLVESLLSPFLFGLRDLWNPVELTVCRVWWPRTPARNFVFSCTAVKMLIDNCVAPLTTAPPLSQAVASLCILYISSRAILHPFLRVCVYILTFVHPRSKFKTTGKKHNKPYFHFL